MHGGSVSRHARLWIETRTDLYHATAQALQRWEPRVKVRRVKMALVSDRVVRIDLWLDVLLRNGRRVPMSMDVELAK